MTEYYQKVYIKCDISSCDDGRLPGLRDDGKCPNCKGEGVLYGGRNPLEAEQTLMAYPVNSGSKPFRPLDDYKFICKVGYPT